MGDRRHDVPREFFLGGRDLEMRVIRELIERRRAGTVHDRNLAWGARTGDYRDEIEQALESGHEAVLIELTDDVGFEGRSGVIVVDHHGPRAGRDVPTALGQVFTLVGGKPDEWTRELALVAANDRGHTRAMRAMGETIDEMRRIRAMDREAQGITPEEERAGREAAELREELGDGRLTIVRLPHGRVATVTDVLERDLGGPGYENLVIFSPEQTLFFGDGEKIERLREKFPGGWWGGELPERGYWGRGGRVNDDVLISELMFNGSNTNSEAK